MSALHRSEFLREAKALFPELAPELNRQNGLLHLEMQEFRRYVQVAIDSGNRDTVSKAYQLAEHLGTKGSSDLVNAVAVSFLEHLKFQDGKQPREWARQLMPMALRAQYDDVIRYNGDLATKPSA